MDTIQTNPSEGVSNQTSEIETGTETILVENNFHQREKEEKEKIITKWDWILSEYQDDLMELQNYFDQYIEIVGNVGFDGDIHECNVLIHHIDDLMNQYCDEE